MVSVTSMPARTLQTCRKPPRKVAQRPHNNDSRDSVATSPALSVLGYVRGGHHTSSAKQCRPSTDHYRSLQSRASHQPFIRTETTRWKSTPRQAERDILNGPTAQKWMRAYFGKIRTAIQRRILYLPFHIPSVWWSGTACTSMLVKAGDNEGLQHSIVDWVWKFGVE